MMAKGCVVAWVLPQRCVFILLPKYIYVDAIIMRYVSYLDKKGVLQQEYFQPQYSPLLTSGG